MPFYREHECNLSAPYIRGVKGVSTSKLQADDVSTQTIEVSDTIAFTDAGVKIYTGSFSLSTTHTFTSAQLPPLGSLTANGELVLYLNNDIYANVSMAALVRAKGTTIQALIYQRVGNFTSVEMSVSGNNVVVTCSPAATCNWMYRGI